MGPRILRACASALLLLLVAPLAWAGGEDALARAEALRDAGRNDEAIAAAQEALASDAPADVKARAQYVVAFVLDYRRHDRAAALEAYRTFLARWKHPRLTGVVRGRVAELERMLAGPDADLLRAIEDLKREFPTTDPRPAIEAFRYDLLRRRDSPVVARGWELAGDLETDARVKDWDGAIDAYTRAASMEPDARRREDIGHKIDRASVELRRVRLYHVGVALLALVLSATAVLLPKRAGRVRFAQLASMVLPWALLTGAFWALQRLEAREDPENPLTVGRILLFAALSLVPCLCSALLSRSLGRAARLWVPLASLFAMLGMIAVFCHHFDYFHLFGL